MAYDIGTARGVIEMEYNGRGIDQAKQDLNTLEDSGNRAGLSAEKVGRNAGRAGLVIAAGLGLAVNSAANFEQRLSAIEAVSGATASEMDKISDKALQLGADTSFSAGEAATAMEELIKAGLSVDEVLNGAADATVSLAAAGEIDLASAAMIASNSMNQFNLSAKDMTGVVDSIAGAANASAIDVSDFGQSLSQVGAVANLAGVDFDDTATAIALLGNAGIKGSDAGTSLKSMFQRLQPTTTKQAELFEELGLITEDGSNKFYDQQGRLKDLASVSGVLQKSLQGMTKQQKQATLNTLFGSDAIRAAAILSNEGAKGFREMAASMKETSAADVAATRLDNFKGSLEAMMGSLETLGITIGMLLLPPLRAFVDMLTNVINKFTSLSDTQQKWVVGIIAGTAALLLIVSGIAKLIVFINAVRVAFVAMRATAALAWLAALGPIRQFIQVWVNFIKQIIAVGWQYIKAVTQAVWVAIKGVIQGALNIIKGVINVVMGIIRGNWGQVWQGIVQILRGVWQAISGIVRGALGILKAIIQAAWGVIKAVTSAAWNGIKAIMQAAWSVLVSLARDAWNRLSDAVSSGVDHVINFVQTLPDRIRGALSGAASWLYSAGVDIIQGLIDGIMNKIGDAVAAVQNGLGKIRDLLPGSPVKEGPLKVLNHGYAGKQIVQMVIDGLGDMAGPLASAMSDTLAPAAPGGYATPLAGSTARPRGRGRSGRSRRARLIDGELRLDPSGRAFISGVAQDADDDGDDYDDTLGRMG